MPSPSRSSASTGWATPSRWSRFLREIRAASQLSHPNVVHAFDAGEEGGVFFFAMEVLAGADLSRVVKERGPLPVAQACEVIRQAALGLQHGLPAAAWCIGT